MDVLVGAMLIGVALAVIVGLTGRCLSAQKRGDELATAAALADEQLQLVLARGPDEYAKRFALEGACEPPFNDYRFKLEFAGGSASKPYEVSCTISWSLGLAPQSIVIQTLMATRDGGEGEPDPIRAPDTSIIRTQ